MHKFWKKVEHYNSKLIFPALILLLVIIIFELFIEVESHLLEMIVEVADYFVIAVFVIDLIFLAVKAKSTKFFFKNYWLDILAVFPFAIAGRVAGSFLQVFTQSEFIAGQAIFHESLEVSKVSVKAERFSKISRGIKLGARSLRIVSKGIARFKRKKLQHVRI